MLVAAQRSAILMQAEIVEDLAHHLRLFANAFVGVENVLSGPHIEHNPSTRRIFVFGAVLRGQQYLPLRIGPRTCRSMLCGTHCSVK